MTDDIARRVRKIITDQLAFEGSEIDEARITDTASLTDDLWGDSLDLIEMVMEAEEQFGCEISDKMIDSIKTVGDFIAAVRKAGGS